MAKSRVTVVGLGLIGSSIGLALKAAQIEIEVVGHDKDHGVAGRALKRGAVDKTDWNLIGACEGSTLIILALPLAAIKDTLIALGQYIKPNVIVTDTATTKVPVLEWAKELPQGVHFIGGHPVLQADRVITGQGVDAADAKLFAGATYCLTPATIAQSNAVDTLSSFATMLGAKPYFIDAAEHDGLMTSVDQLPALLATTLASLTMFSQGWRELAKVAGSKFNTATSLLPDDAQSAKEQFIAHRAELLRLIDATIVKLRELRGMIDQQDAAALEALAQTLIDKRTDWLNGKLDQPDSPQVNWQELQGSTTRLFLGGLASRISKPK